MILEELTVRLYGRYQKLLAKYDDAEFAPLIRAAAMVQAARDAGLATDLPEPLREGDLLELRPTKANRDLLLNTAVEIQQHINALEDEPTGEA